MSVLKNKLKMLYHSLPWWMKDRIEFIRAFGRFPCVHNPRTFNEKVLYSKRHACISDSRFSLFADKYLVRNYVAQKIGSDYLIPLYNVFFDIETLKNEIINHSKFVLKPNHGAGMVKIVDTVQTEDEITEIINSAKQWMSIDFSNGMGERHYSAIQKNILMEERIGKDGEFLVDYKIYLFRHRDNSFFYVLQIIDDRFVGDLNRTFYINNFDDLFSGNHILDFNSKFKLEKALSLSKILIDDLEYARIDWYIVEGQIYFGEITLTPAAGIGKGYGHELDLLMGEKWDLNLAPR